MIDEARIQDLGAQQLRQMVRTLIADVAGKDAQISFKQATIDKLTHEMAVLKRLKFAAQPEVFNAEQRSLLDETIDTDLATLAAEIEQTEPSPHEQDDTQKPNRQALPANRSRREINHEPENTTCACGCQLKRIGQESRNRWTALTRYIDDGDLPADNNWVENQIRPIALGCSNWLFAGSLRAGKRAAAVKSLVHSARLN